MLRAGIYAALKVSLLCCGGKDGTKDSDVGASLGCAILSKIVPRKRCIPHAYHEQYYTVMMPLVPQNKYYTVLWPSDSRFRALIIQGLSSHRH